MSLFVLIPLAFVVAILYRIVTRGMQMRRLVADGVQTVGRVTVKVGFGGGDAAPRTRALRYEYTDAAGTRHTQRSLVSASIWAAAREGSPIDIVYSASRPSISAPRHMVEAARGTLRKR